MKKSQKIHVRMLKVNSKSEVGYCLLLLKLQTICTSTSCVDKALMAAQGFHPEDFVWGDGQNQNQYNKICKMAGVKGFARQTSTITSIVDQTGLY